MKRTIATALLAASLTVPYSRALHADEEGGRAATKDHEKTESLETQSKEEQKALEKYNKASAEHGKDSAQAKKAWDKYAHEMKEHGHAVEGAPGSPSTTRG